MYQRRVIADYSRRGGTGNARSRPGIPVFTAIGEEVNHLMTTSTWGTAGAAARHGIAKSSPEASYQDDDCEDGRSIAPQCPLRN
jgi:hypothetical protein